MFEKIKNYAYYAAPIILFFTGLTLSGAYGATPPHGTSFKYMGTYTISNKFPKKDYVIRQYFYIKNNISKAEIEFGFPARWDNGLQGMLISGSSRNAKSKHHKIQFRTTAGKILNGILVVPLFTGKENVKQVFSVYCDGRKIATFNIRYELKDRDIAVKEKTVISGHKTIYWIFADTGHRFVQVFDNKKLIYVFAPALMKKLENK